MIKGVDWSKRVPLLLLAAGVCGMVIAAMPMIKKTFTGAETQGAGALKKPAAPAELVHDPEGGLVQPPPVTVDPPAFAFKADTSRQLAPIAGRLIIQGGDQFEEHGDRVIIHNQAGSSAAGSLQERVVPRMVQVGEVNGQPIFQQDRDSQTHELLSDTFLANSSEPWRLPDVSALPEIDPAFATDPDGFQPYQRDENLARPWADQTLDHPVRYFQAL